MWCCSRQMVFFLHRKLTSSFLPPSNLQHHIRLSSSQVGVHPDTRSWMSSYSRRTSKSEDLCTNRSMPIWNVLSRLCQCRSSQWPDLCSVLCSASEPQSNSLLYSRAQSQNPLMFLQLSLRTKEGLLRSHNGFQNHILYIMLYSKDQYKAHHYLCSRRMEAEDSSNNQSIFLCTWPHRTPWLDNWLGHQFSSSYIQLHSGWTHLTTSSRYHCTGQSKHQSCDQQQKLCL